MKKQKMQIRLKDLKVSHRMQHSEMDIHEERLCRFTYDHAGKFIQPTYEQWERGFLCDMNMEGELLFWVQVVIYLRLKESNSNRPMTDSNRKKLVQRICGVSMGAIHDPKIRDWFNNPADPEKLMAIDTTLREIFPEVYRS